MPILLPDSNFVFFLELASTFVKLYFVIVIPLDIGFDCGILYKEGRPITFVFGLLLILYFCSKLLVVYYEYGQPVYDKGKVVVY